PGVLARLPGLGERMGVPVHLLRGNHDQFLLDMLDHPDLGTAALWCLNGGATTLAQLGIAADEQEDDDLSGVATRLRQGLGPTTGSASTASRATRRWPPSARCWSRRRTASSACPSPSPPNRQARPAPASPRYRHRRPSPPARRRARGGASRPGRRRPAPRRRR